ncbi:MAG: cupin domain-containing protein [Rhodospirillales bacterium]|nr:cupin domain-containing protein [Rhodospirillales bacterium]
MESVDGETVRIGQLDLRFLVDEKQGSGDLVMFEFTVPPAARVPVAHYHETVDEVVFGLEGTLTVTRDGEIHEIRKGDVIVIPRGCVHHHQNLHEGISRSLVVLNPGTIGRRYFEEIASAVNVPCAPDPNRIHNIMMRYGLIPA